MKKENLRDKKEKLDIAISDFMTEYYRELDALEFLNELVLEKRKEIEDLHSEMNFK